MAATYDENGPEETAILLPNIRPKCLKKSIEQDQEMAKFPVSHTIKGRVNQHQQENLNMTDHKKKLIDKTSYEEIDAKQDKANIATHLPDSYKSDQDIEDKTRKCSCNCTPYSCNCPTCCSCFDKFPDKESIKKARRIGMYTLLKYIASNLIYPVTREVIVYGGLIVTSVLFVIALVQAIIYHSRSDKGQIVKTFKYINLGVSMFGLLFVILDTTLHFRHHGCRLIKRAKKCKALVRKDDDTTAEYCDKCCADYKKSGFVKNVVSVMDITRIFILETIYYPNLLIKVFDFIILLVDNNYALKMIGWTDWFTTTVSFLASLLLVYVHRIYVFAKVMFLIRKLINKASSNYQGIIFIAIFVLYMYGLMLLQILMIVIIGSRFHYEYANNKAIETSWQLWYMMLFPYLMPILGMPVFFLNHHFWTTKLPVDVIFNVISEFQAKGKKDYKDMDANIIKLKHHLGNSFRNDYNELEEVPFWKKFIYPYISPVHGILITVYILMFSAFFVCCTLDGPFENWLWFPFGNWLWFYVATAGLALIINIYSSSVTMLWLIILSAVADVIIVMLPVIAVFSVFAIYAIILCILDIIACSPIICCAILLWKIAEQIIKIKN